MKERLKKFYDDVVNDIKVCDTQEKNYKRDNDTNGLEVVMAERQVLLWVRDRIQVILGVKI